ELVSPVALAADLVGDRFPPPFESVRHIFVDGFAEFSPVEWKFLEWLSGHADLWVSLPDDSGEREDAFATVRASRTRLLELANASVHGDRNSAGSKKQAALAHLGRHLFGPTSPPAKDASGLQLIEAAGDLGEVRLVARRIRSLLADGVPADAIVVTARDLTYCRDLWAEVFVEYGIPSDIDGDEPLARNPAVATLLRAVPLPDEGWPFSGVTALLRSTYFRPRWPEAGVDTPRRAESLLRLLGEPRDREAYLRAVRVWSEQPPDGLEDEQAEETRRLRKARLAAECRPCLERFFRAWDGFAMSAPPPEFAEWVAAFAAEIGLQAATDGEDRSALEAFFAELQERRGPVVSRSAFLRGLFTIAASRDAPRPEPSTRRVRAVAAQEARHLECDYLFVLGLGEKSFPKLGPPTSLLDDADRIALRDAGLPLPDPAGRLSKEELLFLQLVALPCKSLALSYPAVDERGQPLLPETFLRAVRECFPPDAIPAERQRVLIEAYTTREALCPAEARV